MPVRSEEHRKFRARTAIEAETFTLNPTRFIAHAQNDIRNPVAVGDLLQSDFKASVVALRAIVYAHVVPDSPDMLCLRLGCIIANLDLGLEEKCPLRR